MQGQRVSHMAGMCCAHATHAILHNSHPVFCMHDLCIHMHVLLITCSRQHQSRGPQWTVTQELNACSMICNRWHSPCMPSLFLPRTRVASPGTSSTTYQELPKPPSSRICVLALSQYTFALLACACSAWPGEAPGMQQVPGSWLGHRWHHSTITSHSFNHSLNHASCPKGTVDLAHDTGARHAKFMQMLCRKAGRRHDANKLKTFRTWCWSFYSQ